jgi:hypothetical protein
MADAAYFDPAAWAQQWVTLGGRIDWDGLRWPFPIWLEGELRLASDEMHRMLVGLTAEQGEALRTWALRMQEASDE